MTWHGERKRHSDAQKKGAFETTLRAPLQTRSNEQIRNEMNILGVNPKVASALKSWYEAGRKSELSAPLDNLVTEAFNLDKKHMRPNPNGNISPDKETIEIVKKIYWNTQEYIQKNSDPKHDYFLLYRGGTTKDTYNLSSWTETEERAIEFAKNNDGIIVIEEKIPKKRVFLYHENLPIGDDYEYEMEMVVMRTP